MQNTEPARLVYSLSMEDLAAQQLFQFRHSPTVRKTLRRSMIGSSLAVFLCILCATWLTRLTPFWLSLVAAIAGTLWTVGYYLYFQKRGYIKRVRKLVQNMYAENRSADLLGEHTLEVDAEGITHISAHSRTRYAWEALRKIESEPGYTYMYLGPLVFVIHQEAILSGDIKVFLEQIGRYHQHYSLNQTPASAG